MPGVALGCRRHVPLGLHSTAVTKELGKRFARFFLSFIDTRDEILNKHGRRRLICCDLPEALVIRQRQARNIKVRMENAVKSTMLIAV